MKQANLMLILRCVCSLFLVPALLTLHAAGQEPAEGTIQGRVLNATSGQYVKNARVTVEGTTLEALSNEYGEYRLTRVPGGPVTLRVSYGGLPSASQAVSVSAGQVVAQDFQLGGSPGPQREGETVKLDEFVVASTRETNAAAIAINEQRYASNIKTVVSSDEFGDVTEGNVGEFIKFLPGITVDYNSADVRTISVRGFDSDFTGVNVDGSRMAGASSVNANRAFELEQVSLNNVARIEVTKVPTPEMPADGLGGSVNMISRNAFEQARPTFRYRVNLSINSENRDIFKKTAGPGREDTYKALPGFEFNYIAPLSKTLGIVVNGLSSRQFNENHRARGVWNFNNAAAGATSANPYMRTVQLQDGPKSSFRDSLSLKVDWKFAPNHVLSVGGQSNLYRTFFGNRNINYDVGTNPAPTPATGTRLEFGPTFVQSATGRGSVAHGSSFRNKHGVTSGGNLIYRYNGRWWGLESGFNASHARTWYRDLTHGRFAAVSTTMRGVGTVRYDDITYPLPQRFTVRAAAGNVLDQHNLGNFNINSVTTTPSDGEAHNRGAYLNVKREIDLFGLPFALKAGAAVRSEDRDNRRYTERYTFVGADGIANTADDNAAAFLDTKYFGMDPHFGVSPIQWPDLYKLAEHFREHPAHFSTATTAVADETSRINNSEKFTEVISSGFVQGEANLFRNRLRIVTGVRYEKTHDRGEGVLIDPDAPFQRDANGQFARVNGVRVRKPEAGAGGSLQELALVRRERAGRANRTYDGYYPSFHSTFNVRENLLLRFAYAKTFGRPNLTDIIPNTSIDEADAEPAPGSPPGVINMRNAGLKPWTAHNYDVSLEYYFEKGGVVSVGGFQKDVANFWNALITRLTPQAAGEFGLDPAYVGWELRTRTNGGDASISGIEANYKQSLSFIPKWGRYLTFSANATRLYLEGSRAADFSNFIPRTGNVGFTYSRLPINIKINMNYRGRQKTSTVGAINGFRYYAARKFVDVNAEYQFSRRMILFVNGRNIFHVPQELFDIGNNPAYSQLREVQENGVQWGVGVKGSF